MSLQIIPLISSLMNSMFARYWLVMGLVDEGRTLLFSIIDHYFAKKELKKKKCQVLKCLKFGCLLFKYIWYILLLFFWIIVFTLLFIQGVSRSLRILVSWGIKLVVILRIVSLKIEICFLTPLLEKALSQFN